MSGLRPAVSRAVAEWDPDESAWLFMDPDGAVSLQAEGEDVIRALRAWAQRRGTGFDVTVLDWCGAPEGFVPPVAS